MSKQKPGILILSHGNFCQAAFETAIMLGGSSEAVSFIKLQENVNMEAYTKEIDTKLKDMPAGSLVLVDVFGGTPFNTLARLLNNYPVFAATGFNISMLVEAMAAREYLSGKDLLDAVISAGNSSIKSVNDFLSSIS